MLTVTVLLMVARSGPAAEEATILWYSDPAEAHQLARQRHVPMLLLVTMDGCFYCAKMKRSTYRDQVVAADIRRHFVAARIDAKKHVKLAQELGVKVYPTTVIISPDYKVMDVIRGYVDARHLRQRMALATRAVRVAKANLGSKKGTSRY